MDTNEELEQYLEELECSWHFRHFRKPDFEPIDYDMMEGYFYQNIQIENACDDYENFLKCNNTVLAQ